MNLKIMIAMHKPCPVPADPMYLPVFVGAFGKEDIRLAKSGDLLVPNENGTPVARDDDGASISVKNPGYCELTALYWAWKNSSADVIGLVHYRRFFGAQGRGQKRHPLLSADGSYRLPPLLSREQCERTLCSCDILVPQKRRYVIESLYSHYAHTFRAEHLDLAREILISLHPEDAERIDRVYRRTWGYMFNMFIMRREDLDDYCRWLFPVLEELEKRLRADPEYEQMSAFERRLYGRVSEILFNVWIERRKEEGRTVGELSVVTPERVNWLKKGSAFLRAKFFGKKYRESF